MPKVHIRPATAADIPGLSQIDASYTTEGLWRPDMPPDDGLIGVRFRETRLPRSVRVASPRSLKPLLETWSHLDALLVAGLDASRSLQHFDLRNAATQPACHSPGAKTGLRFFRLSRALLRATRKRLVFLSQRVTP